MTLIDRWMRGNATARVGQCAADRLRQLLTSFFLALYGSAGVRFTGGHANEVCEVLVNELGFKGLVGGKVLYTDSTHLKANANKNKFDEVRVEVKPVEYLAQLDQAVEQDRAAHGKRELKAKPETAPATKEIKVSLTDKDSGYMVRDGKPKGFFYPTTARWTAGTRSSPTRTSRRPTCTTQCRT